MTFPNAADYQPDQSHETLRGRSTSELVKWVETSLRGANRGGGVDFINRMESHPYTTAFRTELDSIVAVTADQGEGQNFGGRESRDLPLVLENALQESQSIVLQQDGGITEDHIAGFENLKKIYNVQVRELRKAHSNFRGQYASQLDFFFPERIRAHMLTRTREREGLLKQLDNRFLQALKAAEKKRPRNHPKQAVAVWRRWLHENFHNPYPNDREKVLLATQTGTTVRMVNNWFINARVREWRPKMQALTAGDSSAVGDVTSMISGSDNPYAHYLTAGCLSPGNPEFGSDSGGLSGNCAALPCGIFSMNATELSSLHSKDSVSGDTDAMDRLILEDYDQLDFKSLGFFDSGLKGTNGLSDWGAINVNEDEWGADDFTL